MTFSEGLDPLDRRTLMFWRIANLVLWPLAAFVAASIVSATFVNLERPVYDWFAEHFGGSQENLVRLLGLIGGAAAGALIGSILGSKVYRSVIPLAGIVAALDATPLTPLRFGIGEHSFLGFSSSWFLAVLLLEVGTAMFFARRAWRHRPAALRGGQALQ